MSKSVSEIIIDTLINAGAKRCYGIPGDTINHFTNTLHQSDLEWITVRHEEVGAFAAGAEAYFTGELALCAGTTGPGSLHFVNGIFESHRNGSPMVWLLRHLTANGKRGFLPAYCTALWRMRILRHWALVKPILSAKLSRFVVTAA